MFMIGYAPHSSHVRSDYCACGSAARFGGHPSLRYCPLCATNWEVMPCWSCGTVIDGRRAERCRGCCWLTCPVCGACRFPSDWDCFQFRALIDAHLALFERADIIRPHLTCRSSFHVGTRFFIVGRFCSSTKAR